MAYSILRITDGTNTVDLIDRERGFLLKDWQPAISPFKGGGVWQSSPLSDGRRMVMRKFDNAVETFEIKCSAKNMDGVIDYMQKLIGMLEKALAYWTTDWQKEPVWLEVRGAGESNARYTLLKNYTIPGLSSPFAQPFFSFCRSLNEFTLIVERDHWLDHVPGLSSCVQVNTLQDFDNDVEIVTVSTEVTDNDDDVWFNLESLAGDNANNRNYYGVIPPDSIPAEVGLRFQNIAVPQGATIWRAYLKVCASSTGSTDTDDMDMIIMGENVNSAGVWETSSITGVDTSALYTNYMQRKQLRHTNAVATITSPAGTWHTDKETQYIYGLEAIVQEIVDRTGWASGNNMAFFMQYRLPSDMAAATDARSFYSHDVGVAGGEFPPTLYIEYITGDATVAGREATCTGKPFIANKHIKSQITHIFRYEDTDADETPDTFTANLIGSGTPYDLMQNPISENDELYLGISSDVFDCSPFDSAVFDLSSASVDVTLTWYYCSVAGPPPTWVALPVYGNGLLDIPGETIVYWAQPPGWVKCTVNGQEGYWIKVKFTNVVVTSVPPTQQNRDIYTCIMPFLDIDSAQVPGELPALARLNLFGTSQIAVIAPDTVIMGLRSKSRGEEFSPYLNFADINNPRDISMYYSASLASLDVDPDAPAGKSISVATSAISGMSFIAAFTISSDMAIQYRGRYRAYLRCFQSGGAAGNIRVKLSYRTARNDEAYTESRPTKNVTAVSLIDMGIIEFGTDYTLTPNDYVEGAVIGVYQEELSASSITMRYFDLILMPADEYFGMYTMIGWSYQELLIVGNYLDIDAIGNPRTPRSIMRRHTDDYATGNIVLAEWEHQSRGGPVLQANADQRLWFLTSYGDNIYSLSYAKTYGKLYRCSRYLSMRGAE